MNPRHTGSFPGEPIDFWQQGGSAMCAFQAFANKEDWFSTLSAFADLIHQARRSLSGPKQSLHGADIGSGFCYGLRHVIGLLHFRHRLLTYWDAFEPDREITNVVAQKTLKPRVSETLLGPGLRSLTSDLDGLFDRCRGSCDLVTLMHPAYYVPDAVETVARCYDELLGPVGVVAVLQMSAESPFYILDDFRPRNRTYDLASAFPRTKRVARTMDFRIPDIVVRDAGFQRAMFRWMSGEAYDVSLFSTFVDGFVRTFGNDKTVDLADEIVIIEKG